MKQLICPFKWAKPGSIKHDWSDEVESTRKDVERTFGILKKRWRCLINPIEFKNPTYIEQMFQTCCVLHNMLLDFDGLDIWEGGNLQRVYQNGKSESNLVDASEIVDNTYIRSQVFHQIAFRDENANTPGPNISSSLVKSISETHDEQSLRLLHLINHYKIAKEKNELFRLKRKRQRVEYPNK